MPGNKKTAMLGRPGLDAWLVMNLVALSCAVIAAQNNVDAGSLTTQEGAAGTVCGQRTLPLHRLPTCAARRFCELRTCGRLSPHSAARNGYVCICAHAAGSQPTSAYATGSGPHDGDLRLVEGPSTLEGRLEVSAWLWQNE